MVRSASALLFLLFKNCGLWTLSCDFAHTINETLKWLTQLHTLICLLYTSPSPRDSRRRAVAFGKKMFGDPSRSVNIGHMRSGYKIVPPRLQRGCEPVWPSGKALGWEAEGPWFDPLRLSFLFSSKIVVYGHCLVTLPTQLMKH